MPVNSFLIGVNQILSIESGYRRLVCESLGLGAGSHCHCQRPGHRPPAADAVDDINPESALATVPPTLLAGIVGGCLGRVGVVADRAPTTGCGATGWAIILYRIPCLVRDGCHGSVLRPVSCSPLILPPGNDECAF